MAFEGLSSKLQEFTRKLKGKARITESDLRKPSVLNPQLILCFQSY